MPVYEKCSKDAGLPVPKNAQEDIELMCNKDQLVKLAGLVKCLEDAKVDIKAETERVSSACGIKKPM